jgi:hypothetical protein
MASQSIGSGSGRLLHGLTNSDEASVKTNEAGLDQTEALWPYTGLTNCNTVNLTIEDVVMSLETDEPSRRTVFHPRLVCGS